MESSKIEDDIYYCNYDCGFCGLYNIVESHEKVCPHLSKSKN